MSDEIRAYVDAKHDALEARIRVVEKNDARAEVHNENVEKRLSKIDGNVTWLIRLILGTIVVYAVSQLGFTS